MPGTGPKSFPCVLCEKRTKPGERRNINKAIYRYLRKHFMLQINPCDVICNKCRQRYYAKECNDNKTRQYDENTDDDEYVPPPKRMAGMSSPPSVSLQIPSTSKSHSYCFVCRKPGHKLVVVSSSARFDAFLRNEIIIPAGSRCCPGHLHDGLLTNESTLRLSCVYDSVLLNRTSVLELLKKLRNFALKNEQSRIDFDSKEALSSSDFINLTGITKDNFDDLSTYIKESVRNTPARSTRTSLGIYLFKLKSGISNKVLSTIFNISKSSLRRAICSVRQALLGNFVPENLGISHISREEVIRKHTRQLAQNLFGDITNTQAILVLDGTYIYIQKSNNFQFQRRTYSVHKGRPLIKPMVVVTTTGYFVTVLGPYFADAKNNDANILKHILKNNVEDIKDWLQEEDIFVVDRGFRDALELLEDMGIKAEMPCFMKKGQKQMSTNDANTSRLVTKVRWVVESANARIKKWKYMSHVLPTNQVPFIGDDVRIICSICNKYLPPLSPGNEDEQALAAKMLHLSKQINSLRERIEAENLERRKAVWKDPDDSLSAFPCLDEAELRDITCGSYQLKLSASYMQEHLQGNCQIHVHEEDRNLIRVRLQSRHITSKTYLLWIEFSFNTITAWYCTCRAGARVVGVCSHIAAVLWYLGYARHNPSMDYGVRNWGDFVTDAQDIPQSIDLSDSDDSFVEE